MPGDFDILNVTPEKVFPLGTIKVSEEQTLSSVGAINNSSFYNLKKNDDIIAQVQPYKKYLVTKPDYVIDLTVDLQSMGKMMNMNGGGTKEANGTASNIEWDVGKTKVKMNEESTPDTVRWILMDNATGNKNQNITLEMKTGDIKKIRFYNDPTSAHPMQHPIHVHGLRFLVLSQDEKENDNLVWKDTVLVPTGSTVDILLLADNPGLWQFHCHISEHLGSGMKSVINVT